MKNGTGLRGLRKQVEREGAQARKILQGQIQSEKRAETFWQRILRFIRKQRPSAKEKALAMLDDLERANKLWQLGKKASRSK